MKKITYSALLLLLLSPLFSSLSYAGIYGTDNRYPMYSSQYPFSTIGSLRASDGTNGCTATLISPCHILTAAHCLRDRDGKMLTDSWRFTANQETFSLSEFISAPKWSEQLSTDWAVAKVRGNPGKRFGYMKLSTESAAETVAAQRRYILAGFSGDYYGGYTATIDDETYIPAHGNNESKVTADVLYFLSNTFEGSSGAAIWYLDEKNEAVIVGVNTRGQFGPNRTQIYLPEKSQIKNVDRMGNAPATRLFYKQATDYIKNYSCEP